jgi:hypothetical protein
VEPPKPPPTATIREPIEEFVPGFPAIVDATEAPPEPTVIV